MIFCFDETRSGIYQHGAAESWYGRMKFWKWPQIENISRSFLMCRSCG